MIRASVPRVRNHAPNLACLKHLPEIASICITDVCTDACSHVGSPIRFEKL